jgi:endo-1,4-beta-xylanase
MKNIYSYLVILITLIFGVSCSNGGPDEEREIIIPANKIQAKFDFTISATDPNVLLLNNTTQGTGEYTSVWDYGKGGATVTDTPGIDEVRYDVVGEYTITLTVTNSAGSTSDSKRIIVDEDGICPNGICNTSTASLKEAATTFSVGMITRASYINGGGQHTALLKSEFNNLTSEYEMKMNIMYPSEGNYDFSAGDAIVAFAQANNMNVHGHALIWHNATPSWVENFAGTDAEFEAMVEEYITTTLNHFKGKVRSWDVVNEAIDDGSGNPRTYFTFKMIPICT